VPLVFGAIAPHGGLAIPEACAPEERDLAVATQRGMVELGARFDAAAPRATVLFTPHNVHVEGALAVIVAARIEGSLGSWDPGMDHVRLAVEVDLELALAVRDQLREIDLPALGVSFGGNDPATAVMPMDWATLIPLWYLGARGASPPPVVVVTPARELSAEAHVRAGAAVTVACERLGRRAAVIASADHGHGHRADGPYGFSAASKPFDDKVVEIVRFGRLEDLVRLDRHFVDEARADSWWQMLMLHGALAAAGGGWQAELLSYEAPTYFGMLCASFVPKT
jgi:aromatic ring-opening dioxygenase LigB subunit